MMRTLLNVSLGLILAAGMTGTAAAQGRVATLDLAKVYEGYWKYKEAKETVENRAAELNKEKKAMLDDRIKLKDEYEKLLARSYEQGISDEERDKRKKAADAKSREIKDLEGSIAQFDQSAREQLAQLQSRMRDKLLDAIRRVINSKAKIAGYALVVDTSVDPARGTGVVLYSNNDNDITDAVLNQLNTDAPPESAKTAGKPADTKPAEAKKDANK